MARTPQLVLPDGRPMRAASPEELTSEIAAPSGTGVRPVVSGHPAQGLTPARLTTLLREAEAGEPLRYLELAEEMEEKDLHYLGVLGARKRAVAGLEIAVEAASDAAAHKQHAELVREALQRESLQDDLFDILDSVGKGFSCTEIVWTMDGRRWLPERFAWRDARWFRFDQVTGSRLMLRDLEDKPLPPYKFITHITRAKSGIPIRGGLARAAAWAYLFKNFTLKDWVSFAETYGQPMRIGKYAPGTSEPERDVLRRALANLGTDWSAMIPETMMIELIEAKASDKSAQVFQGLADWLDQQVSKAVLGQTATTDAIQGGYAVGRVHDEVRVDIMQADAVALGATLNRDVVRPIVDLNHGPQDLYPRVRLITPDTVDVDALSNALERLVPLGLQVSAREIRGKLGLSEPAEDADLLAPPAPAPGPAIGQRERPGRTTLAREGGAAADEDLVDEMIATALEESGWREVMDPVMEQVRAVLEEAGSFDQARDRLAALAGQLDTTDLAELIARAAFWTRIAGEVEADLDGD